MKNEEIGTAEALAFLRALAPKLAQLKQRLAAAGEKLKIDGPGDGRLNALIDAQLALKEFLSGLADFSALVEPIDIVVAALREEAAEQKPPAPPVLAPARAKVETSPEAWLRVGTAAAVQKLINAGMPQASAEHYLANTYAGLGLTQRDGTPICVDVIKTWFGSRTASWRNQSATRRRMGGLAGSKGPGALTEAQARVDELSAIFKRMAATAAN
jgi:hypothetical protein